MEINTSIEIKLDNILKILTANNDNLSNLNISEHKVMNILSNSQICLEQIETIAENYLQQNSLLLKVLNFSMTQIQNMSKWVSGFTITKSLQKKEEEDNKLQILNNQCEICKNYIQKQKVKSLKNDIYGLPSLINFANNEIDELLEEEKEYEKLNHDFYGTTYLNYQKKINNLFSKAQPYITQLLLQGKHKDEDFDELSVLLAYSKEQFSEYKAAEMIKELINKLRQKLQARVTKHLITLNQMTEKQKQKQKKYEQEKEMEREKKEEDQIRTNRRIETKKRLMDSRHRDKQHVLITYDEANIWKTKYLSLMRQVRENKIHNISLEGEKSKRQIEELTVREDKKKEEKQYFYRQDHEEKIKRKSQQTLLKPLRKSRDRKVVSDIKSKKNIVREYSQIGIQCIMVDKEDKKNQKLKKKKKKLRYEDNEQNDSQSRESLQKEQEKKVKVKKDNKFKVIKSKKNIKGKKIEKKLQGNQNISIKEDHYETLHQITSKSKVVFNSNKEIGKKSLYDNLYQQTRNKSFKNNNSKRKIQFNQVVSALKKEGDQKYYRTFNDLKKKSQKYIGKVKESTMYNISKQQEHEYNERKTQMYSKSMKKLKKVKTQDNQQNYSHSMFPNQKDLKQNNKQNFENKLTKILKNRKQKSSKKKEFHSHKQHIFGSQDFDLMGGISEAYHYRPSSKNKTDLLDEKQVKLLNRIVHHIDNLSSYKNDLYGNTISFLTKPYETVEKGKLYCDQKLQVKELWIIMMDLLQKHKKSCHDVECIHMRTFLEKTLFQ